jgi:cysteine sulfinate desulfinase/cysteine desulfurase-like protein
VFLQIDRLDVDSFFSNIESVHRISAKLLALLEEATTDVEPAMQVIGMFIFFSSSRIQREITF